MAKEVNDNELDRKFNKYISKVKKLESVSNDNKLFLYANYKQALFGDNNIDKPSIFNRVEMEKWKAWDGNRGITKDEAKERYIRKVKDLYK
jgi:diazepam-binding inhibitor (GABA receptor modulating acyl-CoA-binding protein)